MINIRKAVIADVSEMAKVYVNSWKTTYRGMLPDEYLDNMSYTNMEYNWKCWFNNAFADPLSYVAVDEENNMVGLVSSNKSEDKMYPVELSALYLLNEHMRRGIGRNLLRTLAKDLKERNSTSVIVWVLSSNSKGISFYKHMGGKEYIQKTSEFDGIQVEDISFVWDDISHLCEI